MLVLCSPDDGGPPAAVLGAGMEGVCIFLGEVSFKVFDPFLNQVVYILTVEF